MKKDDKASVSLKKVISVTIILLLFMGISVMAVNSKVNNVKIILADGYEMEVLTTKENVSDILNDNHIIVLPEEKVVPELQSNISDNKTIRITAGDNEEVKASETAVLSSSVTAEDLLQENYNRVVEKLVVEETNIPFETETKNLATGNGEKKEVVTQNGEEGTSETTYKVRYENDIEVAKAEISTQVTKEPINKVVEVRDVPVVSRATVDRASTEVASQTVAQASASGNSLAARAEGRTPQVVTLNASAYTASTCDKAPGSPGYGITASGARATAWCTVAAGKGYPMGTIIYIPYFANKPNGGWFIVQDRGGAIANNKLDIYMDTYNECINFGRRNLECYVYVP
ncbi:MAG: G5 domain-containing protein [Clostridia bacterium]|nr:G5 domain-containing protein [Clostridia bacterium]